ncbi:hypothetical protein ACRQ5Q_15610 [Bradyrhizobium sp. PMVTL-01]|uniref:hypothetical protein n=1 Tax=unclassified Bradyrhizobium TaxID=2631580 RepID=UPI003F722202
MGTGDLEWLAEQTNAKLDRLRAGAEREREMIRRSFELIAEAEELLSVPPPKVWRPERSKE